MRRPLILAVLCVLAGCDQGTSPGTVRPAAAASAVPILAPFQGKWKFSLAKTIAYWQAHGVAANEIAQAQALGNTLPLAPDMNLVGDVATLPGVVEGEYQFFALHLHGTVVCGKAWHHEDRHDPGDMDKQLVRLQIEGTDLLMSARINDDSADPADPDITTMPLTAGSAATCDFDKLPTPPWSAWTTYVYEPVH